MSPKPKQPGPDEMSALLAMPSKVGKYEVRAWTVKRFAGVYPVMRRLIEQLVARGLTLDNAEAFIAGNLLDCLPEMLPEVPPLLAATLDIPLEEAEDLDIGTATALLLTVHVAKLHKGFALDDVRALQAIGAK